MKCLSWFNDKYLVTYLFTHLHTQWLPAIDINVSLLSRCSVSNK